MFIFEEAKAPLLQHLHVKHRRKALSLYKCKDCELEGHMHFAGKCQKMMCLQASVYLGIPIGMHISKGMSTDIPLCVNVCS